MEAVCQNLQPIYMLGFREAVTEIFSLHFQEVGEAGDGKGGTCLEFELRLFVFEILAVYST